MITNDKNENTDINTDLNTWIDAWDKFAQSMVNEPSILSNVHTQSVQNVEIPQSRETSLLTENQIDWSKLYEMAQNVDNVFKKKDLYGLRPNPITTASKGKDQELRVTPNFSDGEELRQLNKTKLELHALEGKILASEIQGENVESLKKQLEELCVRVDLLSNSLTPSQEEDVT